MVENDSEIKFEKPKGSEGEKKESDIHVMPERFRGVTVGAKIPKESSASGLRGEIDSTKSTKSFRPEESSKASKVVSQKRGFPWLIVIIVIVIFVALGASIFLVLQGFSFQPEETETVAEESITVEPEPASPETTEPEEPIVIAPEVTLPATAEVSIPATSEVVLPIEPEESPVVFYTGGVDADSDGLTDFEEGLYNTDPRKPDTDSDGFLDGNEVYHLYNPGGTAPVTLLESELVVDYESLENGYMIYYPSKWALEAEKGLIMFLSESGELVQILVEENTGDLALEDWYKIQAPEVDDGDLKSFTTKSGIEGLQSPDRLTAYFKRDSKIFIISLNISPKTVVEFRRTYEMMLNSFKFFE